jgi:hypothetical protein
MDNLQDIGISVPCKRYLLSLSIISILEKFMDEIWTTIKKGGIKSVMRLPSVVSLASLRFRLVFWSVISIRALVQQVSQQQKGRSSDSTGSVAQGDGFSALGGQCIGSKIGSYVYFCEGRPNHPRRKVPDDRINFLCHSTINYYYNKVLRSFGFFFWVF